MTLFRQILLLLALAASGAFLWHALAADPGYVLVAFRGWSVETTLLVAALLALVAGFALWLTAWLLRTPFVAWRRQRRRLAQARLADGLVALEEGRWKRADKLLFKAASDPALRLPALLAACRAAQARGEDERASALLAEAGKAGGEASARLLTVERLLQRGQYASAAELLENAARSHTLPPRGLELRGRALAGAGRAVEALDLLPELRRSRAREGEALETLEREIIAAALAQSDALGSLMERWRSLSRAQRIDAAIVDAFAARAAALGDPDGAADAVVHALKKHWSEALARRYGALAHGDRPSAIKLAERWLQDQPQSTGLRLALGRLCRSERLWGKAEEYLRGALGGEGESEVWEALGELYVAQDDDGRARQAYANALRAGRGEVGLSVRRIAREPSVEVVAEERSSMGVPRLPGA